MLRAQMTEWAKWPLQERCVILKCKRTKTIFYLTDGLITGLVAQSGFRKKIITIEVSAGIAEKVLWKLNIRSDLQS